MLKIDLRRLILLSALAAGLVTLINGLSASYITHRDLLMSQTLEANHVYAVKQALNADHFIRSSKAYLALSAQQLVGQMDKHKYLKQEVDRLRLQSHDFDSTFIVGADGRALATSPNGLGLVGTRLQSEGALAIIDKRTPVITDPYVGSTNRLLIVISHPIIGSEDQYLGYVSASIYLQEKNILNAILDEQYRQDGFYAYVVDRNGRLIYHPDSSRIGEVVSSNAVVKQVTNGKDGAQRITNLKGLDMLAGFAPMKSTGWGVVAQTPTRSTLPVLKKLILDTLLHTVPFSILTLLGIWWLSWWIAQPLKRLADNVKKWEEPETLEQFRNIKTWYFEADQLKFTIIEGLSLLQTRLSKLNRDTITDPLTSLNNRRGLRLALDRLLLTGKALSVISLDIDHFKDVNDRYGHDIGDQVLKYLAEHMRECFRADDVLCRAGGEEFIVLLPEFEIADAHKIAERLRLSMASQPSPSGEIVTISLGVAYMPRGKSGIDMTLRESDEALYEAKSRGRNRVISAS